MGTIYEHIGELKAVQAEGRIGSVRLGVMLSYVLQSMLVGHSGIGEFRQVWRGQRDSPILSRIKKAEYPRVFCFK